MEINSCSKNINLINACLKNNLINFEKEKFEDLSVQNTFAKKVFINNILSFNNCL